MKQDIRIENLIPENDERYLSSVARAFSILEALSIASKSQSLTELSRATDVSIPTLQRMTKTLETYGYISKNPTNKRYSPAIKTIDVLHNYLSSNDLAKIAWPHLVHLRESTGLGVSFAIPTDSSMLYVHGLPSYRGDFEDTLPGKNIPLHLSASGRCLLSSWSINDIKKFLDRDSLQAKTVHSLEDKNKLMEQIELARNQGYSIVEQEMLMGISTISVPVLKGSKVCAGISIHTPTSAWSKERLVNELSPKLLEVARALSK